MNNSTDQKTIAGVVRFLKEGRKEGGGGKVK